jgi:hypothetical protein
MQKRASSLSVCVAVGLAALAAIFSVPTMAQDVGGKLLSALQTQADANEMGPGSIEELNKLGLP